MAEIFSALRSFLLSDPSGFDTLPVDEQTRRASARAAIVAAVHSRIYPGLLPQGALTPAIVITKVSGVRSNVLGGPASMASPRYQIDCWVRETSGSAAWIAAQELGGAVLSRLEAYHGLMSDDGTSPVSSYRVAVIYHNAYDDFEPDVTGGYRRHCSEYFVSYGVNAV